MALFLSNDNQKTVLVDDANDLSQDRRYAVANRLTTPEHPNKPASFAKRVFDAGFVHAIFRKSDSNSLRGKI